MLGQGLLRPLDEREKRGIDDVYLLRLEQFYPWPMKSLTTELSRFTKAELVWCQEEPKNMGGWTFVDVFLQWMLDQIGAKRAPLCRPPGLGLDRGRADDQASARSSKHFLDEALAGNWSARSRRGPIDDIDILMPTLGESVTEATVGSWAKKPGDAVAGTRCWSSWRPTR